MGDYGVVGLRCRGMALCDWKCGEVGVWVTCSVMELRCGEVAVRGVAVFTKP